MAYLITQILVCILIAAAIGFVLGWLIRSIICARRVRELENKWSSRVSGIEEGQVAARSDYGGLSARVGNLEEREGPTKASIAGTPEWATADAPELSVPTYEIEDIEGIGRGFGGKLRGIGIATTLDLLDRCTTEDGIDRVSESAQIEKVLLRKCTSAADLLRVPGVDPQNAELLEASGISTVQALANQNATSLSAKMEQVNQVTRLVPDARASANALTDWIGRAKDVPPKLG